MRHINFLSGALKVGVLGEGQNVYVEKVYVLFLSLSIAKQVLWGLFLSRMNPSRDTIIFTKTAGNDHIT